MSASTQATELQAAIKKTLHSASFGRFMAQAIQTSISEAEETAAQGVITLLTKPAIVRTRFHEGGMALSFTAIDSDHNTIHRVQKDYQPDCSKNIGRWYGSEMRTDTLGREWSRLIKMVQDDFGNLVEVSA